MRKDWLWGDQIESIVKLGVKGNEAVGRREEKDSGRSVGII